MGVPGSAVRSRHDLQKRLNEARNRTDEVFQIVREEAMYDRPINERHRIIFYVGHVEAFDWNLLAQRAFGLRSFHETFDKLFAFGIDPVGGGLPTDKPSDWPSREEIDRYNGRLRSELDRAIGRVLSEPSAGHPLVLQMLEVAIEHRLMHAETLAYMLHQLPADRKIPAKDEVVWRTPRAKSHLVEVQSGHATLGMQREQGDEFGWDNEFEAQEVFVPEFAIDNYNVKNRDFLLFMQAGGYTDKTLWDAEGWAWRSAIGNQPPDVLAAQRQLVDVPHDVRRHPVADGLARVRQSRGSVGLCEVAGAEATHRRTVPSCGLRDFGRARRAHVPMGR